MSGVAYHPTHAAPPPAPVAEPPWRPCPMCWGQRRIWSWNAVAECLVPRDCDGCLGTGEVPSVERGQS